jgi:ATP-dependent helicase HrpA
VDALLKQVRDETSLDVKRADFKLDMLSPHLFMNFRITDEHGRQLGQGRNLGALKAEWGAKARGAFQALAGLKLAAGADSKPNPPQVQAQQEPVATKNEAKKGAAPAASAAPSKGAKAPAPTAAGQRYTAWTFGALPELMEISKGGQTLIGFPALIDGGDAVSIEVFDEPEVAAARHRAGLRRLVALQIKDALKYLEKNIPDLQKMAVAYMPLGTQEELRAQIIDVALDRAFLQDPLPADEASFAQRVQDGRGRLTLIANEVARMAGVILVEYAAAQRKIKDTKNAPEATKDTAEQLQRLVPKNFIAIAPWPQLQHYARYLKAITTRLDKYRTDPARDSAKLKELQPLEQRYWRLVAERKGAVDARMQEYRWMLEELRVSFFAQELRTPYPVSAKRLDKVWGQLQQ